MRRWAEEAWRNLGLRHALLAAATAAAVLGAVVLTGQQATAAVVAKNALDRQGQGVWQVQAAQQGGTIDTDGCERLNRVPGAQAGGWGPSSRVLQAVGRSGALPVLDVTPGALRLWRHPDQQQASVLVGRDFAGLNVVRPGALLRDASGADVVVDGSFDDPAAPEGLRAAILRVTIPARLETCMVRLPPCDDTSASTIMQWAFDTPVVAKRYLPPVPANVTPEATWSGFSRRAPWLWLATLPALVAAVVGLARRREWALYRTLGAYRYELAALAATELMLATAPVACLAIALGLVITAAAWPAGVLPSVILVAIQAGAATLLLSFAAAFITHTATQLFAAAQALKE